MKKVIVTGANGFIGNAVVLKLLEQGLKVIAIDISLHLNNMPINNPNLVYYNIDVKDINTMETVLFQEKPDTLYHFAWVGSSGKLREDIDTQISNALTTVNLLKFAKNVGCKRMICAGTIMEYEIAAAIRDQETKPQMSYTYGIGKSLAHNLCKLVANDIGIELIWTHITNSYGPGEYSPRLINTTIRKIIHQEDITFTSGTQNYDFIYISDVANAFYLLGEKGKPNSSYVIGSGQPKALKLFIRELFKICDDTIQPVFGDVSFTGTNLDLNVFSIDNLTIDTGFKPLVSFSEGIKYTKEWLQKIEEK